MAILLQRDDQLAEGHINRTPPHTWTRGIYFDASPRQQYLLREWLAPQRAHLRRYPPATRLAHGYGARARGTTWRTVSGGSGLSRLAMVGGQGQSPTTFS
jgi:hypothetical protein